MVLTQDPDSNAQKLVELGGDIGSGIIGAALGFLTSGPTGAVAGAIIAPPAKHLIVRTLSEIYERFTGERGRLRAGKAAAIALSEIAAGLAYGRTLRTDGFFNDNEGSSPAEQILEGVLLKCRDSFEEKKALYIGNIFARAAFEDIYAPEELSFILKLVDELTYRQFILLRIYQDKEHFSLSKNDYSGSFIGPYLWGVLNELVDLIQKNLISGSANLGSNRDGSIEPSGIFPEEHVLTEFGKRVAYLLNVRKIPDVEVTTLAEKLR